MKQPDHCQDLAEVRAAIDQIDQTIIKALGERFNYVKKAAEFKPTPASVRAPERMAAMLAQRRAWAIDAGLDPDVIEAMYRDLIDYFVGEEQKHWDGLARG